MPTAFAVTALPRPHEACDSNVMLEANLTARQWLTMMVALLSAPIAMDPTLLKKIPGPGNIDRVI